MEATNDTTTGGDEDDEKLASWKCNVVASNSKVAS